MTRTCAVKDCTSPREAIFTVMAGGSNGIPLDFAVCHFHNAALRAGEAYEISANSELVLGADGHPKVLNFRVKSNGIGAPLVTMILGHDGVESSRMTFTIDGDMANDLAGWVQPHK